MQQGLLPDSVIQAYEQVTQKRGSSMRTELTNLINQTMERIPGSDPRTNSYVVNEEAEAVLNTTASHDIKKHNSSWSDGVIFEEAVTRCGNQQALWEAVSQGRVASEGDNADWKRNVYKFPRTSSGAKDVTVKSTAMQLNSLPDDGAVKELFALIDGMQQNKSPPAIQRQAANAGPQFPSTINFTSRFRSRPPHPLPPQNISNLTY